MAQHIALDYQDPVPEGFFDPIQELLSGAAVNIEFELDDPTTVRLPAGAGDAQASISIGGQYRWVAADLTRAHPGGAAGTYDLSVTSLSNVGDTGVPPGGDYSFALAITPTGVAPAGVDRFRVVRRLQWNGAAITSIDDLSPLEGPSGPAGGDLAGTYPNPRVAKASAGFTVTGSVAIAVTAGVARQQLSVGDFLDLYSGAANAPAQASIRASSAGSLALNAKTGASVFLNIDNPTGSVIAKTPFTTDNTGVAGMVVKAMAGQTANLLEAQDSTSTVLARIGPTGNLTAVGQAAFGPGHGSSALAGAQLGVDAGSAGVIPIVARAAAGQTASIFAVQTSDSVTRVGVSNLGGLFLNNGAGVQMMSADSTAGYWRGSGLTNNANTGAYVDALNVPGSIAVIGRTTTVPTLVVRAVAAQTGNILEAQDSTGAVLASIDSLGKVSTNQLGKVGNTALTFNDGAARVRLDTANAAIAGLVIKGTAAQSANLQEWQDSTGAVLSKITNNGSLQISANVANSMGSGGTAYGSTVLSIGTTAVGSKGVVVRGVASQAANLQEWQDSTGAVLASVQATGLIVGTTLQSLGQITLPTNANLNFGTSLITQGAGGSFAARAIDGNGNMLFAATNDVFFIVDRANTQTNRKIYFAHDFESSASSLMVIQEDGTVGIGSGASSIAGVQLGVVSTATGHIGAVVRGAAGQTADLQQWQDPAGVVLVRVTAAGSLTSAGDQTARSGAAGQLTAGAVGPGGEAGVSIGSAQDVKWYRKAAGVVGTDGDIASRSVTAMPAGVDGQEVNFVADAANGVVWRFKYRAASTSPYKWECIGGSDLRARVDTNETRANAAYGDMATVGPSIVVPLTGEYDFTGGIAGSAGNADFNWSASLSIGGVTAVDADSVWGMTSAGSTGAWTNVSRSWEGKAVTAGQTAKLQYATAAGGTTNIRHRWLRARPVRVA